jgi:hypothetical protein
MCGLEQMRDGQFKKRTMMGFGAALKRQLQKTTIIFPSP